ncbi:hypothetical protein BB558_004828, partial [Smittium angustum]
YSFPVLQNEHKLDNPFGLGNLLDVYQKNQPVGGLNRFSKRQIEVSFHTKKQKIGWGIFYGIFGLYFIYFMFGDVCLSAFKRLSNMLTGIRSSLRNTFRKRNRSTKTTREIVYKKNKAVPSEDLESYSVETIKEHTKPTSPKIPEKVFHKNEATSNVIINQNDNQNVHNYWVNDNSIKQTQETTRLPNQNHTLNATINQIGNQNVYNYWAGNSIEIQILKNNQDINQNQSSNTAANQSTSSIENKYWYVFQGKDAYF